MSPPRRRSRTSRSGVRICGPTIPVSTERRSWMGALFWCGTACGHVGAMGAFLGWLFWMGDGYDDMVIFEVSSEHLSWHGFMLFFEMAKWWCLAGGLEHFLFHNIWDVILPVDELIFFKMVIAPPSRCSLIAGVPMFSCQTSGFAFGHHLWSWLWSGHQIGYTKCSDKTVQFCWKQHVSLIPITI